MPESYEAVIAAAMLELKERAYREQRNTDDAFEALMQKAIAVSHDAEIVMGRLPESDRQILELDATLEHQLTEKRMEFLYLQGAKDFIKLMRELGAF